MSADLATVSFRTAGRVAEDAPWGSVGIADLSAAGPWRTFRWHQGQKHYSGSYWSATMRDHVIYESRLELSRLLIDDFNRTVHRILAQPFLLKTTAKGKVRKHIPDYLLIGHDGHEEVIGTLGEAPDHITLVDGPGDVERVEVRDPDKVVWLSQTTLSVDETMQTVNALKTKFPNLLSPPSDDICYATQNRQLAVKQMSAEADLVIVVGSSNSSNSQRLVEVAEQAGAQDAYLVDTAGEIDAAWLDDVATVGVTSGASVPEVLVEQVLDRLAVHGYQDVALLNVADESQHFALPRELHGNTVRRS